MSSLDVLGGVRRIDKFRDNMKFVYHSTSGQNAKFVYTKLGDISLGGVRNERRSKQSRKKVFAHFILL